MDERQYIHFDSIQLERKTAAANALAIISAAIAVLFIAYYVAIQISYAVQAQQFFYLIIVTGFFLSPLFSAAGLACGIISLKKKAPLFVLSLTGTFFNSVFLCIALHTMIAFLTHAI